MRAETEIERLESELAHLHSQADEESQRQWRLKRAKMSELKYQAAAHSETAGDYQRAAQYLYEASLLGNRAAEKRLYLETSTFSDKNVMPLDDSKPDLLFYKGFQAFAGIGQPMQANLAFQYFQAAAELRYAPAQSSLGRMYWEGLGVQKDDIQAVHWFSLAAEQGVAAAQNYLGAWYQYGRGVQKDDVQAVHWYRLAAEQGYALAQYNFGSMYRTGHGVPQDYAQAVHWYLLAAEQGVARAQYNLGWMYRNGHGVQQDYAQAVHWYLLAAEQGLADAQNNLGSMYRNGLGVQEDDAQAVHWYRLAAEQGEAAAQDNLGRMYQNGAVPILPAQILEYRKDIEKRKVPEARRALVTLAEQNNVDACYHLAIVDQSSKLLKILPNDFFEALMADSFLDEKGRLSWIEKLFEEHHRTKGFWESQPDFDQRPRLSEENLISVNFMSAKFHYATLSQMARGHNNLKKPKDGEKKRCVDLSTLPKAREKMELLLEILSGIPEEHPDFPEAQFITAHLNYIQNPMGEIWKQHFTSCLKFDADQKWVDKRSQKNDYDVFLELLNLYQALDNSPENIDKKEAYQQMALREVGKDSKSFLPLFRLSLLTETPEKRQHYLISLKTVDENFSDSKKWLACLKKDAAIDAKKEQEIVDEMESVNLK
jgi:TPR repeat protein